MTRVDGSLRQCHSWNEPSSADDWIDSIATDDVGWVAVGRCNPPADRKVSTCASRDFDKSNAAEWPARSPCWPARIPACDSAPDTVCCRRSDRDRRLRRRCNDRAGPCESPDLVWRRLWTPISAGHDRASWNAIWNEISTWCDRVQSDHPRRWRERIPWSDSTNATQTFGGDLNAIPHSFCARCERSEPAPGTAGVSTDCDACSRRPGPTGATRNTTTAPVERGRPTAGTNRRPQQQTCAFPADDKGKGPEAMNAPTGQRAKQNFPLSFPARSRAETIALCPHSGRSLLRAQQILFLVLQIASPFFQYPVNVQQLRDRL